MIFNSFYATVTCMYDPLGAMDTEDIVGLKWPGLTSDASGQCRRCAMVFFFRYNSMNDLVSYCFRCLNSIFTAHNCQFSKFQVSVAEQASLNQYRLQTPKTWLLIKWLM